MTRRKFIVIAFAAFLSFLVAWPMVYNFNEIVRRILERELSKMKVSQFVLDSFIRDAGEAKLWNQFTLVKKLLIRFHFSFDNALFKLPYYNKYLHYRNIIMEEFLLSTDFVVKGMEVNNEVRYLGLFNPYKRFCFNPFSDVFYST